MLYSSAAYIAWALAIHLSFTSFTAPSIAAELQPTPPSACSKAQVDQAFLVPTSDSKLFKSSVPSGIECYNSEPGRPPITYDSCLSLFSRISRADDFRRPKAYSHSRTPSVWRDGRDCEIQVWSGGVSELATNQYVAAMAAWYEILFSTFYFRV